VTFYVGAQGAHWLPRASMPVMLSRARLKDRTAPLPASAVPWFLDSGAFTELEQHGTWTIDARTWAQLARRWSDEAGQLAAVATQDWLCTPPALAMTRGTVAEHQQRTVHSYLDLMTLDADLPWVPTLQGWWPDDYRRHAELFAAYGVDLAALPLVGVGSIAMRQHTDAAAAILTGLARRGLGNLHAYGAKELGLLRWGWAVASADSMAWSTAARRDGIRMDGCTHPSPDCRNCQPWAEQWARNVARLVAAGAEPLVLW
jgi:hypothetical protein